MPLSLRLIRVLVTTSVVASVASIPLSCAVGSSPYDLGNGGSASGTGGAGPHASSSSTGSPSASSTTGGFPSASSTTGGFPSASSSSTTSGFTTSSSTSSSGSPSSACDVGGPSDTNCGNCGSCAQNSVCFNETFDCELDCDCYNIIACIQAENCQDSACVDMCRNLYPAGTIYFDPFVQCLDCACVQTCAVPAGTCP